MSTFNGFVPEFPNIRIDYFRTLLGKPPPLACFLSHVHSDHLQGLESLKSPFIYCSATTRELLLRLEKYPHRMNFSKGILECRKQTYKHLQPLLKPLPLETPTKIELSPGNEIQVTLFDANHCAGAVMFLVEGKGKAILYTGDVRSEDWWVNALTRHPMLLPYTTPLKRLEKIYLDTTFATKTDPHRCFPSKASGIQELLQKVAQYPESTIFYFQAWTFGYEDVWLALSQALQSPVHLDRYRYGVYTSVSHNNGPGLECRETPMLSGFKCGNTLHKGILTKDSGVRLHSCESGTTCDYLEILENEVVTITPIISRHDGIEVRELGAGGGQGDLNQVHELDLSDPQAVGHLLVLCSRNIKDHAVLRKITDLLSTTLIAESNRLQLDIPGSDELTSSVLDLGLDQETVKLDKLPNLIAKLALKSDFSHHTTEVPDTISKSTLPKSITFPYSRHSSYTELRHLVSAFRPREVWPCTVPPDEAWHEGLSMSVLFGDICGNEGTEFAFDRQMRERLRERLKRKRDAQTQREDEHDEDREETRYKRVTPEQSSDFRSDEVEFASATAEVQKESSEDVPRGEVSAKDSANHFDKPIDLPNSRDGIIQNKDPIPSPVELVHASLDYQQHINDQDGPQGGQPPHSEATLPEKPPRTTQRSPYSRPHTPSSQPAPTIPTPPLQTPTTSPPTTPAHPSMQTPNTITTSDTKSSKLNLPPSPPTSTSTTTSTVTPTQRLRARKEAYEKARAGRWHEVRLESVRWKWNGGGWDEGGEREEEL